VAAPSFVRIPVLLLAMAAAGACTAAGVHFHGAHGAESLHRELTRLRDENEALTESARLARHEQQDLARIILDPKARQRLTNMMERSQAFDETARRNGFRSSPENTAHVRKCLGQLLKELNITSLLDVPCSDGNWQHLIPGIRNVTYVGADINMASLEKAKHLPENKEAGMEFMLFDSVHFPLKRAFDLVLYRGAVEQQRVQDSLTAVLNFKTSGSRYIAASYWPDSSADVNEAAHTLDHAGWYEANLLAVPFSFPQPLASCENEGGGTEARGRSRLGVWRLKDLPVTPAVVRRASPDRHQPAQPQGPLGRAYLPQGVHVPRQEAPQQLRGQRAPAFARMRPQMGQPLRFSNGEMSLDDLMGIFGSAFAPEREHLGSANVHEEPLPFDGLFSDWLETAGPVRRGLPARRPGLPTQLFRLPGFAPRGIR